MQFEPLEVNKRSQMEENYQNSKRKKLEEEPIAYECN